MRSEREVERFEEVGILEHIKHNMDTKNDRNGLLWLKSGFIRIFKRITGRDDTQLMMGRELHKRERFLKKKWPINFLERI